jgi:hypothetical protein
MLRCHHRARSLRLAIRELLRYRSFADVKLHILADRLSFKAQEVLDEFKGEFWGVKHLDYPILSPKAGEQFREAKRLQFQIIQAAAPDWVLLADDDRWFEPLGAHEELPRVLADGDKDIWYATSWFVWDQTDRFNAARHHHSPVLFRFEPGLEYPLDRDIQVPLPLHDEAIVQGRAGELQTPLLDFGTFEREERARVYKAFVEAGKIDAYVEGINGPPDIRSIDEELKRPWKDLWKEEYGG